MEQKKQQSLWSRLWRAGLLLGGGIGFGLGMVAAVLTLFGGSLLRLWYPSSLSVGALVLLALSLIVGITLLGTLMGWGVASHIGAMIAAIDELMKLTQSKPTEKKTVILPSDSTRSHTHMPHSHPSPTASDEVEESIYGRNTDSQ